MNTAYYPLVKQGQFPDLQALCRQINVAQSEVEFYVKNARIEGSPLAVCDRITLGDPAHGVCAVIDVRDDGVGLWAGLFGEMSDNEQDVLAFIEEAQQTFNRDMAVGEFSPRRTGALT